LVCKSKNKRIKNKVKRKIGNLERGIFKRKNNKRGIKIIEKSKSKRI
jgi:hypothetical protein